MRLLDPPVTLIRLIPQVSKSIKHKNSTDTLENRGGGGVGFMHTPGAQTFGGELAQQELLPGEDDENVKRRRSPHGTMI